MEVRELATILAALLGAISGVLAIINQRKTAKETHQVAEAAHIIGAYDKLCQTLRSEIDTRAGELDRLRSRVLELEEERIELRALRKRVADIEQREAEWADEKARLECRIRKLEEERDQLKAQLEELREHARAGKE